jgi:alkylhydroperoxidase family enzyme
MMFLLQSQNNGCQYCQAHSVSALDRNEDVSAEKIAALWDFETSPIFSDAERVALRFALAVSAHPNAASDDDFDALKVHYSEDQIVELVAIMSIGSFLNTWNDTMATQLEDESAKTAKQQLGHRGWKIGKHA